MAFAVNVVMDLEYRGREMGYSQKNDRNWMTLKLETDDADILQVSVPVEYQSDVLDMNLERGDMLKVRIRLVATSNGNSYIMMTSLPEIVLTYDEV